MAAPTATQIRNKLEGYGITTAVLSDSWVEDCRDNEIIPHIEDITGLTFNTETEVTEYYSGTGKSTLILNRRPVNSITTIIEISTISEADLSGNVELISEEGIIKVITNYGEGIYEPIFRRGNKNIKVTYTYGFSDYPSRVAAAIKNLVAAKMLNVIGARTGGGSLGVQAFNRNYGSHGKWTDIRKELVKTGYGLLRKYLSSVIGG